jgi:helix-hairpin-helix protein
MPQRDRPRPNQAAEPGDDFRKIAGIGPVLAQRLQDAGILTYEDLAGRTPEEIAAVLADMAGMSRERIASQNWTGQARDLAGPPAEPSVARQHYAAFHVEFLLESDNSIRRTKVHHHQTDATGAWPGWDEERLLAFLRDRIPLAPATRAADAFDIEPPPAQPPDQPQAVPAAPESQSSPAVPAEDLPSSFLAIEEFTPIRDGQPSYVWRPDEPNLARLTMRVNPVDRPIPSTFAFSATVAARRLGGHDRVHLGTARGVIRVGEPLSVEVAGPPLPTGLYRLVVTVDIYPADHSPEEPPLYSRGVSGNLVQVANAPQAASVVT